MKSRNLIASGKALAVAACMAAGLALGAGTAAAKSTVSVAVVNDFAGWNPYADSTSQMYMIWCQTYGCLGTFDTRTGDYRGILAERWEINKDNPNEWTFHLRKGIKRQVDGKELTAEDVVFSLWRNKNDPRSAQKQNTRPVKEAIAVDKYTVKFITNQPTAPLLSFLFDRLIITGKDLYEKHGKDVDRKAPYGYGPYMVKDVVVGQRMVLEKNPAWPDIKAENPDRLIFRRIKEDEARVTSLLTGEVQIALHIPPHLLDRVQKAGNVDLKNVSPVEVMFLAMNPAFKPWDNKLVRKAVAYAINREAIVKAIFRGGAEVLHGPVGPGQYGYSPNVSPKYEYNPEKAKALLKEAGYPNGVEIDFYTATNRYVNDRQSSQAIVPMLEAVGFKVKFHTPEYSTHWPLVRKGKRPFYYQGRGSVVDPSAAIAQYFETGASPRIKYSSAELDATLKAERREFDEAKRKALLLKAFNIIQEDLPGFFLWRIQNFVGIAKNVSFEPMSTERIFGVDIAVK
jgi:peptide/nickel transport system substrate-binding protein